MAHALLQSCRDLLSERHLLELKAGARAVSERLGPSQGASFSALARALRPDPLQPPKKLLSQWQLLPLGMLLLLLLLLLPRWQQRKV